jgi:transposase
MYAPLPTEFNFRREGAMRKPRPVPQEAAESLGKRLRQVETKSEFQRIQCVWLRACLRLSASEVAVAIGWHPNSVKKLQARYFLEGESALGVSKSGGRYRQNMTLEEEVSFLAPFFERAAVGGVIVANEVKAAYEREVGRKVPKSTIYRMLDRHDWRKIVPRPRHPQKDPSEQEAFKKTSRQSSKRRRDT